MLTPLQKKERSRTLFTTVLIRETKFQAAKPTEACYALIQHSVGFRQPYLYWVYTDLWGKNWQVSGFPRPPPISGRKGLGTPRCRST